MNAHPALRSTPNPDVNTATRQAPHTELASAARMYGTLLVNGWTRRVMRMLTSVLRPPVDLSGVTRTIASAPAQGFHLYRPDTVQGQGAVLLIHGGGYVVGSPHDAALGAAILARECGVPVLAPGYRLGPEHPFPAALDDVQAAWHYLLDHAEELGVDPDKIVIGGYSAGGGHAAALVQRLHDEGGRQPAAQLLVYPMLDDRTAARRDLDRPWHLVWNNWSNLHGWTSYLGHAPGAETTAPYVVPARRDDLSGLPPAWIGVGTPDLFLDEDREYAARLTEAGIDVTYVEVEGGIHGFDLFAADTSLAQAFQASVNAFVTRFTR